MPAPTRTAQVVILSSVFILAFFVVAERTNPWGINGMLSNSGFLVNIAHAEGDDDDDDGSGTGQGYGGGGAGTGFKCSAYYGTACVSSANSCGQTNTGSINCFDICYTDLTTSGSVLQPPPNSSCPQPSHASDGPVCVNKTLQKCDAWCGLPATCNATTWTNSGCSTGWYNDSGYQTPVECCTSSDCSSGYTCASNVCSCTDTSWSPAPSDTCSGISFTQTSNCNRTRTVSGTKSCTCSNGATDYPTCTGTCANGADNYPTCTAECANHPSCSDAINTGTYSNGCIIWVCPTPPPTTCTNGAINYPTCTIFTPTASFSASPTSVSSGNHSTLYWSSTNATSCSAGGPWSNSGTLSGSGWTDPLFADTTFTFQCTGPGGTTPLQTATVAVFAPVCTNGANNYPTCNTCTLPFVWDGSNCVSSNNIPVAHLIASPSTINSGQSSTLSWTSEYATTCTGTGFTAGGPSGTRSTGTLSTPGIQNYQVICTGAGGNSTPAFASVTVLSPDLSISANPVRVQKGTNSTITWSATSATSCSVSGPGLSSTSKTGSRTIKIDYQSTYTLTCIVNGSSVSSSATVNILPVFQEF